MTEKTAEIDQMKGSTLEDISKMVEDINREFKKMQSQLQPLISELKEIRKEYNNVLNNALNFPIQSAATSIVNRACIAMTKQFKELNLDAWVSLQIHDQVVITCSKKDVEICKKIVQDCMENTNKLAMPLVAKPEVANNLKDGH